MNSLLRCSFLHHSLNLAPLGVEASIRYDLDYLRPLFPRTV